MLVRKKFTGDRRSYRPTKYDFSILEPDTMIVISPSKEDEANIEKFFGSVRASLYQYKKRKHPDWKTATSTVGDSIHVYRIK